MEPTIDVPLSDAKKILAALSTAKEHHYHKDHMNSKIHLASEVIFSPLTSELMSACNRLERLMSEVTE